jgi:hypothetical protein
MTALYERYRPHALDEVEACKSVLLLCDGANPSHEAVYHQLNTAINKAELP